jgi:hypothetical protein
MNIFAAHDLQAANLLALARLDDDRAPPADISPPATDGQASHADHVSGRR